jgi:hypothetical protein
MMGRKPLNIRTLVSFRAPMAVFVVLISPPSTFTSSLECIQYNLKANLGFEIPLNEAASLELYDPTSSYFKLGSGPGGGTVYRVIPSDGKPSYALKEYRNPTQRNSDDAAFKRLHHWMLPVDGIEIVQPEIVGTKSMRLPDIKGETLDQVLRDPNVSEAEKKRLLEIWNRFIDLAHETLPLAADVDDDTLFNRHPIHTFEISFRTKEERYSILLKPDNVIVEAGTGRMFLIDPF